MRVDAWELNQLAHERMENAVLRQITNASPFRERPREADVWPFQERCLPRLFEREQRAHLVVEAGIREGVGRELVAKEAAHHVFRVGEWIEGHRRNRASVYSSNELAERTMPPGPSHRHSQTAPSVSPQTQVASVDLSVEEALGPLNEFEQRHAPKRLYLAGDRTLIRRLKVSVVGSRKASDEGLRRAARLTRELVKRNVVVVSGLAAGIDAAAHQTAIDASGRTIAVIGTPLDDVHPKKHRELQALIAREHLVVSQFPSGYPVLPRNFPIRNRTMALIVDASVIVEASDGSGTLSHGWEALRLARPLFIMRSVVEVPGLKWPAEMIDYGALVLSKPDELYDRLPWGDSIAALPV